MGWKSPVVTHPGEHLVDFLEDAAISQTELADRIGLSKKAINEIVNGKSPITQLTAFKLSKVFPVTPEFWINLQNNYDLALARCEEEKRLIQEVEEYAPALRETYQELSKKGFVEAFPWINKNMIKIAENLQRFFAVDSLAFVSESTMEFAFRKYNSGKLNQYTLAAWVQLGKIQAKLVESKSFDKEKLREQLPEIKALSRMKWQEYVPELESRLAECGVILVLAPRLKCAPVQGATQWVESDKVLVMLKADNQYEDRFWFSLFHELGHVLLHGKKDVYVDFDQAGEKTAQEVEADEFAQKWLIPDITQFKIEDRDLTKSIRLFADRNNISPAIVAGRLAHELSENRKVHVLMSPFLKERITYSNLTFGNPELSV